MPVIDRLPVPEPLRHITPGAPRPRPEQDPVDHLPVIGPPATPRRISGQQPPQPLPLLIGQIMTIQQIKHRTDLHDPAAKIHGTRPSGLADTVTGRTEGFLTLKAEGSPPRPLPTSETELGRSQWAGMSGAAVFVGDRLVGVVAEHHLPEGDGSLTVVPITWAEHLPEADRGYLLLALGVKSVAAMEVLTAGAPAQLHAQSHDMGIRPSQVTDWPSIQRRMPPFSVPPMPPHFAARAELLAQARTALLECSQINAATRMVGLVGMGGSGKSVLARALARDREIRRTFRDGIIWLELGPTPNLLARQAQLAEAFEDYRPVIDLQQQMERLNRLLAGKACLVVLDNVWQSQHLRAFELREPESALLVTTRNQDILDWSVTVQPVHPLSQEQARGLLAAWAGQDPTMLPVEAEEVAKECGGLPLALAVAGGMVADGDAWRYVRDRLREADLGKLEIRLADYREYADLLRVLEASVNSLEREQCELFLELAIFDGRGGVPVEVVQKLWQRSDLDDLDIVRHWIIRLARRSLLQYDTVTDTLTLHDLLFDYARHKLDDGRLQALHARLASTFLDAWGGLKHDLPTLWTSPLRDAVDRYGALHLASHLKGAEREEDIHRLLALNSPAAIVCDRAGRRENIWYAVHDRIGESAAYSSDVTLGWNLAKASTDEASVTIEPIASIGFEIRYSLVTASIASIAANIPPELIVALVGSGHWTAAQGLAYARQIPRAEVKAKTLINLLPFLRSATPVDIRTSTSIDTYSIGAAVAISDIPSLQAPVPVAAHTIAEVLASARAIDDPRSRAEVLTALVSHVPEGDRAAALHRAWDAVHHISSPYSKAKALAALAAKTKLPRTLQDLALADARQITVPTPRAEVLTALAPQLPEPDRTAALEDVQAAVRAIGEPQSRAAAYTVLIPHLSEPDRTAALNDAQATVRTINDGVSRAAALTALAPQLPEADRAAALAQALADARAINDARLRAATFSVLSRRLRRRARLRALNRALADARASSDPNSRAITLAILGSLVRKADRQAVVHEALMEAYGVRDAVDRAAVLTILAPEMPEPGRRTVIDEACAAAREIDDPDLQAAALTTLASKLPEAVERQALAAALAIDKAIIRSATLADALKSLVPEEEDRLVILREILPAHEMDDAELPAIVADIQILAQFPERECLNLLKCARVVTEAIGEVLRHAATLATLTSKVLTPSAESGWVTGAVGAIAEVRSRAAALRDLALELPEALQEQGLAAIRAIQAACSWAEGSAVKTRPFERGDSTLLDEALLAGPQPWADSRGLGPQLLEHRAAGLSQALDVARAIEKPQARAALTIMIPRLAAVDRPIILRQALVAARAVKGPESQATALTAVAALIPQLPEPDRAAVLDEAWSGALAIWEPRAQAAALTSLIPQLPASDRVTVLRQVLAATRMIDDAGRRTYTLNKVAELSLTGPIPAWEPYWRDVIEDSATRGRAVLLSDLSAIGAVISRLGGRVAMRESVKGLLDVGRWWP
jgi:hypothetical protein